MEKNTRTDDQFILKIISSGFILVGSFYFSGTLLVLTITADYEKIDRWVIFWGILYAVIFFLLMASVPLISFARPLIGGILCLIIGLGLYSWLLFEGDTLSPLTCRLTPLIMYGIPGLLLLLCWRKENRQKQQEKTIDN